MAKFASGDQHVHARLVLVPRKQGAFTVALPLLHCQPNALVPCHTMHGLWWVSNHVQMTVLLKPVRNML